MGVSFHNLCWSLPRQLRNIALGVPSEETRRYIPFFFSFSVRLLTFPADVLLDAGQEHVHETNAQHAGSKYQQIIRLKAVHLLAVWALIYVGVEVTLGG